MLGIVLSAAPMSLIASDPVIIVPGDDISALVSGAPPGTRFLLTAGVYSHQTITPKSGMSFIGEPGAVLDGGHVTPRAVIGQGTRDVTIRGLRITNYAPPNISAALDGIDSEGWLVEENEIDGNSNGSARAYGVRIGNRWTVRRNAIHDNGWVGIDGYNAVDTLIEANEVWANPSSWLDDRIGEAANIKLYGCGRIVIRGNHVHDGPFRGIWLDRSQPDLTIEDNRVVNHGEAGIWYEASYRGVIRRNHIDHAGYNGSRNDDWLRGGGIQVTNSPDVSVIENTVIDSLNGIVGAQARSYSHGPYGKSELRNLLVRDNVVVMRTGQTGIVENVGNDAVFTSWNNRFVGNHYDLKTNRKPFRWMGRDLDERQWRSLKQSVGEFFTR
jgi:parallel beta-helix repeat protein